MIVNWKKPKAGVLVVPCLNKAGKVVKNLRLLPGHNIVREKDWEQAVNHLKRKIDSGLIEVVTADKVKSLKPKRKKKSDDESEPTTNEGTDTNIPAKSINDLSARKAKKVVKDTWELDTLEKWLEEEGRDEIRALIQNQITAVNEPDAKTGQSNM